MKSKIQKLTSSSDGVVKIFAEIEGLQNDISLAELNALLAVAEMDEGNVGFYGIYLESNLAACGAVVFYENSDEPYGELKYIYVKPNFRGLGLSKAMLSHLLTEVIERGLNKVLLKTNVKQHEAIALYRYFGFYECDSFSSSGPDPEAVFMQLYVADKLSET
jgi:putative acetyltransferase